MRNKNAKICAFLFLFFHSYDIIVLEAIDVLLFAAVSLMEERFIAYLIFILGGVNL